MLATRHAPTPPRIAPPSAPACRAAAVAAALAACGATGACGPPLVLGAFGDPARDPAPPAARAPAAVWGCWVGAYTSPAFAHRGSVALALGGPTAPDSREWLTFTWAPAPARTAAARSGRAGRGFARALPHGSP